MSELLLGRCFDLMVHPVDDIPFIPDDRLPTYQDLFREGPICHVFLNRGFDESGHLENLR